jgi:hypothetical protein
MRTAIFGILFGLALAACGDNEKPGNNDATSRSHVESELCARGCSSEVLEAIQGSEQWLQIGDGAYVSLASGAFSDPCAGLPADGLCASACDPGAIQTAGACVTFACALGDGREIVASSCAAQ